MGSASAGISTWFLSRIREICSGPLPSMQRSKTRLTIWAASSSRIHLSLPLLVAPSAVFVQRANGTHDMKVRIGNADVLLVERMNGKDHYHPRLTKFSNKNCLARAMFSCKENSFCKAMSKLYASCAFFPRSTFSTAFQRVSRSAYSDGACDGNRISEQRTHSLCRFTPAHPHRAA